MNIELLQTILEKLQPISKRKAKKLERLIKEYNLADTIEEKDKIEQKIHSFIFYIFLNCLEKESRKELIDIILNINEICYELEKDYWHINMDGATRIVPIAGGYIPTDHIPREYNKGFYLRNEDKDQNEDSPFRQKEKFFYMKNFYTLSYLSRIMDHKQEFITYYYDTKGLIDYKFTELLIDFLGMKRVEEKGYEKTKS